MSGLSTWGQKGIGLPDEANGCKREIHSYRFRRRDVGLLAAQERTSLYPDRQLQDAGPSGEVPVHLPDPY
jgi:hypothetical protein